MSEHSTLVDRYFAAWNETDPAERRALVAATYAPGARYVDPVLNGEGHDGIDAMIASVHARFPGHRFRRTTDIDAHHDCARFSWELAPADGAPVVGGTDFVVIAGGRLQAVTGFFDQAVG
jgi:hypothetical protein